MLLEECMGVTALHVSYPRPDALAIRGSSSCALVETRVESTLKEVLFGLFTRVPSVDGIRGPEH